MGICNGMVSSGDVAERPAFPHNSSNPEDQLNASQLPSGGSASFVFLDAHAANIARAKTPLDVRDPNASRQTFWAYSKRLEQFGSLGKIIDTW